MLNGAVLRNFKPRIKPYRITRRGGMYALVFPAGSVAFRYDYRLNGRRETRTIGRYGKAGMSLAIARDACRKQRGR
jgi:hypothetical protein